ncbi:SURF1 family protein [Caulobacter sp. DWR1-3-2b1]|uniref:SURF1 family protein n=1 Tax=Caulobacter sp. DWR1-3-2b1 TaxID=2804670 RepID=UPI003CFAC833
MSEILPKFDFTERRRFPIGLTVAVAIAFGILCFLGVWQMKRMAWKEDLLARIEALKTAPAVPIGPVLADAAKGSNVAWTRVEVACRPASLPPLSLAYGIRDGDMVWRAQALCGVESGPYDLILVDRGVVTELTGQVEAPARAFAEPGQVTGVLIPLAQLGGDRAKAVAGLAGRKPAPLALMVERETPAPSGVAPAPLPAEITNRHLEYALTWFGLAVTLLFIYAAMLWRRLRP